MNKIMSVFIAVLILSSVSAVVGQVVQAFTIDHSACPNDYLTTSRYSVRLAQNFCQAIDIYLSREKPVGYRNVLNTLRNQCFVWVGWSQTHEPSVSVKLIDTNSQRQFYALPPGSIKNDDMGIGEPYFRAVFCIPYSQLSKPMKLVFTDTSGAHGTLSMRSLAWQDYVTLSQTIRDLKRAGSRITVPEHYHQLQFCKNADPTITQRLGRQQ